ncbi:Uncharacterized conserved protein, DUF302 family [Roseovarius marisflavi]|uniref:Uncharacterized conserved protein, DUF302 family n=1 Tax=Roseovarius marisflavi TaxID=1054996 RepID=A0A1M6XUI7_9RHOB|nr:DUF302 domain-containing protein [Roseovarius marisflavi]SHL09614.1 Uncharacterized conserved protein, DUF302 family [Roseovarius marisflavi]
MQRFLSILAILGLAAGSAQALEPRDGWVVHDTAKSYGDLVEAVRDAVKGAPIAIVTQASASDGARMQGHEIPGNRIFGLYRNDYARRMLAASVASGIEAPIRIYVTEDDDGTASLSYRTPTVVFAPYFDEGGDALRDLAEELDGVFENIAKTAISE